MSHFATRYGAFVARSTIAAEDAQALADGGVRVLVLQVAYQGSKLVQRSVERLRAEQSAAAAVGIKVWWLAWCLPGAGRPEQLRRRLAGLVAEVGAPEGFLADCEVDGGWSPSRPNLRPIAAAARDAGMPIVGLTSHGEIGPGWPVDAFDVGVPQIFRRAHVTAEWALGCFLTWAGVRCIWPALGCAEPSSDPAAMQADLRALGQIGVPGALWWTARQLLAEPAKLRVAVPR